LPLFKGWWKAIHHIKPVIHKKPVNKLTVNNNPILIWKVHLMNANIFLVILIVCSPCFAITGRIIDAANKSPVSKAKITIAGTDLITFSDTTGKFTLTPTSVLNNVQEKFNIPKISVKGKKLYVLIHRSGILSLEYFALDGKKVNSIFLGQMNKGEHLINNYFHEASVSSVCFLKINLDGMSNVYMIHKIGRNMSTKITEQKSISNVSFMAKPMVSAMTSGQLLIQMDKLVDTLVDYRSGSDNLGDIILQYPPRKLDVGAPPVYGAIVLFNGFSTKSTAQKELNDKWEKWWAADGNPWPQTSSPGKTITFKVMHDPEFPGDTMRWTLQTCCYIYRGWGYDDLVSKFRHNDCQIHVEFNMLGTYDTDDKPNPNNNESKAATDGTGNPGYSNSGVHIASRHEVQIISTNDQSQITTDSHLMASLVNDKIPESNQMRDNGKWQCYDITYRAPRWSNGTIVEDAYITIYWNGKRVHNNVKSNAPSAGRRNHSGEEYKDPKDYGLKLQNEGRDVRYRNIWIKPLDIKDTKTDFGY
jgi:hypothetical protein